MKVLTIREPWASLIINGYKKYEFRSWKTNYRGKLLIHAGKGIDKDMLYIVDKYNIKINPGNILGEVEITDCIKVDDEFNNYLKKDRIKSLESDLRKEIDPIKKVEILNKIMEIKGVKS